MKLRVVALGTIKERATRELIDDYARRIGRYTTLEEVEIEAGPPKHLLNALSRASGRDGRCSRCGRSCRAGSWRGSRGHATRGKGVVAFLIGGTDGLPRSPRWCRRLLEPVGAHPPPASPASSSSSSSPRAHHPARRAPQSPNTSRCGSAARALGASSRRGRVVVDGVLASCLRRL